MDTSDNSFNAIFVQNIETENISNGIDLYTEEVDNTNDELVHEDSEMENINDVRDKEVTENNGLDNAHVEMVKKTKKKKDVKSTSKSCTREGNTAISSMIE